LTVIPFSVHFSAATTGATATMEKYLGFILNVVAGAPDRKLRPLYGISGQSIQTERVAKALAGYRGMGPAIRLSVEWDRVY